MCEKFILGSFYFSDQNEKGEEAEEEKNKNV